mmetsp:Transcript_3967/g.8434  ORF Transcript_3967/g.8434 Transcript_3967/m.8434 type:complete len:244 (-) Transcript_3967:289-1020(-)|eukprot:CAMPEP_0183307438 /NCGR_PEP_ID=MMETSP0160_2-20130417/17331_1 /TAXON_ID=2839 ORGANISM="Odontella Sinensis, Strain Grunow 1884" /NCGR_SAMPLE_ID=MMETSP0160_2 /ASSEMBLY_ACC=CAM_ASM_000250 /LENGTH=243 /DNA_ID=CAMNT_0025471021 /DNA_START=59 /DNA_END=790 /DNA_ORIENTATION=-
MRVIAVATALLAISLQKSDAFSPSTGHGFSVSHGTKLHAAGSKLDDVVEESAASFCSSRRATLARSAAALVGGLAAGSSSLNPPIAAAKSAYPQEAADKEKIAKGFKRLDNLLKNWEKETTICGRGDNPYLGCERTPEKVMEVLGYKSMEDPLFRADKTLFRLQALAETKDAASFSEFQEAVDTYIEKSEEGNGLAFVSSWGEANPGGGRDRVELFIERSRADVTACRDSLATVVRILELNVN